MTKSIDELQRDVRSRAKSSGAERSAEAITRDAQLDAQPERQGRSSIPPSRGGARPHVDAADRDRLSQVASRESSEDQGVRRTTQ